MTSMNEYNSIIENETCNIILIADLDSMYSAFTEEVEEKSNLCNDNKM